VNTLLSGHQKNEKKIPLKVIKKSVENYTPKIIGPKL
jgi:hypothetical protein